MFNEHDKETQEKLIGLCVKHDNEFFKWCEDNGVELNAEAIQDVLLQLLNMSVSFLYSDAYAFDPANMDIAKMLRTIQ